MDSRTVGILGGGQLGRMLVEAANRLNVKTVILDAPNSPAKQISNSTEHIDGSFTNPDDIIKLAKKCDIMTIEIEHIDVKTLKSLNTVNPNLRIYPSPETIELIQDKYTQKEHLIKNGLKVATSQAIKTPNVESLEKVGEEYGYPFVLKSRKFAYDGRGNFVVKGKENIPEALEALKDRSL